MVATFDFRDDSTTVDPAQALRERARADVPSVSAVTALTVWAELDDLLRSPWPDRWQLLAARTDLIDDRIALACLDRDPLLASMIRQSVRIGVEAAHRQFPLAEALSAACAAYPADSWNERLALVVDAATALASGPELHGLSGLILTAIERLAAEDNRSPQLAAAHKTTLLVRNGCDSDELEAVWALLRLPADQLWENLSAVESWPSRAVAPAVAHLSLFTLPGVSADWAAEVEQFLNAAHRVGTVRAIRQHRLVLKARSEFDNAATMQQHSKTLLDEYRGTGCGWLLTPAVALARSALEATERSASFGVLLARHRAWFAHVIAACVGAGRLPASELAHALRAQRAAAAAADSTCAIRCDYQSDLANMISNAVMHSVLPREALREAVVHAWTVVRRDCGSPRRFVYLHTASAVMAEAVTAGVARAALLGRAVAFQHEALAQASDAARVACQSNLGNRISQALDAGLELADTYLDSIDHRQRALDSTPALQVSRPDRVINLAAGVARGVALGIVNESRYRDVLDMLYALETWDFGSDHKRAVYLAATAARIFDGVSTGILPTSDLSNALDLQRQAMALTPVGHPHRAAVAAGLAARILDAVEGGILPIEDVTEAVAWGRESLELTRRPNDKYADRASNLAVILGRAADLGALSDDARREAVDLLRAAMATTAATNPHHASFLDGLASGIAATVESGALPAAHLKEALQLQRRALVRTPPGHPDHAMMLFNLGNRLADSVHAGHQVRDSLTESVELHRAALALTSRSNPQYMLYVTNLGCRLADCVDARLMPAAEAADEMDTLIDIVWTALAGTSWSARQRRIHLGVIEKFVAVAPIVILRGHGEAAAVSAIETLRNHLLPERSVPTEPDAAVAPELRLRFRHAVQHYLRTRRLYNSGFASIADAVAARARLSAAIEPIRQHHDPEFAARPRIQNLTAALAPGQLAVYVLAGTHGGAAIPVTTAGPIPAIELPTLTLARARVAPTLLGDRNGIRHVARWLQTALVTPIEQALPNHQRWLVIPTGTLALLPVHAAGSRARGWADDRIEISVVPGLTDATSRPTTPATDAGVAAVATADDLPFLRAEQAVIRACRPAYTVLDGQDCAAVLNAAASARTLILSGHAHPSTDYGAGLQFGDGTLVVDHLARLPPHERELAVVNSCWGARAATTLVDESVGLPHALLEAGFRSVSASLWPVRDIVSFIFIGKLLTSDAPQHHDRTELVRATRTWLRTATGAELRQFVRTLSPRLSLPFVTKLILEDWCASLPPDTAEFGEPADWGAFARFGK
ncbi:MULTISPECIES: CHAT domain-containing protein [Nocardia]|nr:MULTISPECIES: CHAT domain-containing protein [Nocardia]